ncbi:MAG: hypothetical protein SF162_13260 [bacterium]|nr:hypothetical protein [bacterium]
MRNMLFAALVLCGIGFAAVPSAPAAAQIPSELLAFVNESGQVVVTSSDGSYRWIVTNPGEPLAYPLGYTWSADGTRLFFAVDLGGAVSLRVGDPNAQTWIEIGTASPGASGGGWGGSGVAIAEGNTLRVYDPNGAGIVAEANFEQSISAPSPFINPRPNLAIETPLELNGDSGFVQLADGRYALAGLNGGYTGIFETVNNNETRGAGLWADVGPAVTFWGFTPNGNSVIAALDARTGQGVIYDSGRAAPITPLVWLDGTLTLIYRDSSAFIRAANFDCLPSCPPDLFANGVNLFASTAGQVQTNDGLIVYQDGGAVYALDGGCIEANACENSAVPLVNDADPSGWLHTRAGVLAYTSTSGAAHVIDLACIGGECAPFAALNGARSGLVSATGSALTLDYSGWLSVIDLATGNVLDLGIGSPLETATWNR